MAWLTALFTGSSAAGAIVWLALVVGLGLAIGSVKVRGVSLGVAGVLFVGLLAGHFGAAWGVRTDAALLGFLRDFGLVLFVFMIGLQIGPGFADSLRRDGLALNMLSLLGVAVSVVLTALLVRRLGVSPEAAAGVLAGATTNTPSLAAAQDALRAGLTGGGAGAGDEAARAAGLAYAVAYPIGVLGPIAVIAALRALWRVDIGRELTALVPAHPTPMARLALRVEHPGAVGQTVARLGARTGVTISRLHRAGRTTAPHPDEVLAAGDVILCIGRGDHLATVEALIGPRSLLDLRAMSDRVTSRRVVVTRRRVLGKSLAELKLRERLGVTVTRVTRAGVEIPAVGGLTLNYADGLMLVGPPDEVERARAELGDAPRAMDYPHLIPVVLGLALGVIIGSVPLALPGLGAGLRLGLAGGVLLVAIVVSRVGRVGPLVWHVPPAANFALREGGLALFLASVGLMSGPTFVRTLSDGGLSWLLLGAVVTIAPMLVVALTARWALKMNFVLIAGLLAGHGTQPAVLNFATGLCKSDAPGVAYAAVYPLTLLLRVVMIQLLVQVMLPA